MMTSKEAIMILELLKEINIGFLPKKMCYAIDFAIQAIKERDAAVEDVERIKACRDCKHFSKYRNDCLDLKECKWEWRGIDENS